MASSRFILISLCSLVLLSQLIAPAHSWSCCLKYTKKKLPCKRLLAYSLQTINKNCDINAVIFHISSGRFVCADPLSPQTQRGMQCVDEKRQQEAKIMKE